jgi:predicted nucleotidyltransferase
VDEIARAATLEDLKALIRSLDAHGVEYLLIGGYALAAHGYQRATTDIDLMVAATVEAGERMKAALMVLPDQVARDIDPDWFPEGENIRVGDAIVVDIMLNANGQTYETLKQYTQIVDLDGVAVRTVSLEGLLLTKRTLRDKDQQDCAVIERALAALARTSLADQWNAVPGKLQCTGRIVALSESEVIQDAGRGTHVAWDRRTIQDSSLLAVGESVTIHESGVVPRPSPGKGQGS